MGGPDPVGIGGLLPEVARVWGLEHAVEAARLAASWEGIVGPEVAGRCQPISLKGGVLRLRASSPAWAAELRYLGPEIARRINDALGKGLVKTVEASVGDPVHSGGKSAPSRARNAEGAERPGARPK
ncbi:MAG: DciA family protein [Candidatus Methylomirabilales bacterium]